VVPPPGLSGDSHQRTDNCRADKFLIGATAVSSGNKKKLCLQQIYQFIQPDELKHTSVLICYCHHQKLICISNQSNTKLFMTIDKPRNSDTLTFLV